MSRVYVVHENLYRDENGQLVRQKDVSAAESYGYLVFLLPPGRQKDLHLALENLRTGLSGFGVDDYLLPIGDPVFICSAASIAAQKTNGRLKLLKWNRHQQTYEPVEVELWRAA